MADAEDKRTLRTGDGDVPFKLAGEQRYLRPTPKAFQLISRQFGGLAQAIQRVERLELDVIAYIIAVGMGVDPMKSAVFVKPIYDSGMGGNDKEGIAPACVEYILVLQNGGKPMPKETDSLDTSDMIGEDEEAKRDPH